MNSKPRGESYPTRELVTVLAAFRNRRVASNHRHDALVTIPEGLPFSPATMAEICPAQYLPAC